MIENLKPMFKNLLSFTLIFFCLISTVSAQKTCKIDPAFKDSALANPVPYDSIAFPNGGIPISACINKPWEFTFQLNIFDSITFLGNKIALTKFTLVPNVGIGGLPKGFTYACNPANCEFLAKTQGCVVIFGTADNTNPPGNYEIKISGILNAGGFTLPVDLPNPTILKGKYIIKLEPETSTSCFVSNVQDPGLPALSIGILPNPSNGNGVLIIDAIETKQLIISCYDLLGKTINISKQEIQVGRNEISLNDEQLASGTYFIHISDGIGSVNTKFIRL